MPLSQRRRPAPLVLVPRQTATPTPTEGAEPESPDSPDSPDTPPGAPDSPDSPDTPTGSGLPGAEEPESDDEEEEEPSEASSTTLTDATSTSATAPERVTAVPPPARTSSTTTVSSADAQSTSSSVSAIPQISSGPTETEAPSPEATINIPTTSRQPTSTVTLPATSTNGTIGGGGGLEFSTELPQKSTQTGTSAGQMGVAAEAALITFSILGAIAVAVGAFLFFRKRRQAKAAKGPGPDTETYNPGNGAPAFPEPVRNPHETRSTNTDTLFAPAYYIRPETVSTNKDQSRIQQPQPTPNPFADPPLNKAYDVLRGRPRSTTLTDRGSWVKNPFKDPVSERFDPFGDLQAKARDERARYIEELRLEQEYLEKEREDMARKESNVTVEGLGVLDRTGSNKYRR